VSSAAPVTGSPTASSVSVSPSASVTSGGSAEGGTLSSATIRVANLFAPKGNPGPALDIYDHQLTGSAATPILTDVAYGTVSAYAHPHLLSSFGQKTVELWALPAGENPATTTANDDSRVIGGLIDDGSHAQLTILLTADTDAGVEPGALSGLSDSEHMESGDDGQGGKGPAAPPPPAGKGEILVDQSDVPQTGHSGLYLLLDHSCAPPINGDSQVPGPYIFNSGTPTSAYAIFTTDPGTHQVSVVNPTSENTPTCTKLFTSKSQGLTSVTVAAGQQVILFVYGSTLTDLHLLPAPIQQ
jgi:hypothetical protein